MTRYRSAPVTYREAGQVMTRVLNYPIFIPDLGRESTSLLVSGHMNAFFDELARLGRQGNTDASTLLAYLHLMGATSGKPNYQLAEELCTVAAGSGNGYAQFFDAGLSRNSWKGTWVRAVSVRAGPSDNSGQVFTF